MLEGDFKSTSVLVILYHFIDDILFDLTLEINFLKKYFFKWLEETSLQKEQNIIFDYVILLLLLMNMPYQRFFNPLPIETHQKNIILDTLN